MKRFQRFHLTENGPKRCTASVRECPVGGAHFGDEAEAKLAYEFSAAKKHGVFGGLKKEQDPHMLHVSAAAKRLRQLEKDMVERDKRQEGSTVFHQLLAEGITEAELEDRFKEDTSTRQAGIGYMSNSEGAAKPVGLSYGGDYKAEEEWGMAHIAKSLKEGTAEKDDVRVYQKGGYTIMAVRGENSYDWEEEKNNSRTRAEATAAFRYRDWHDWDDRQLKWKLESLSAAEVREKLKGRVKPLPKTKAEAITKILELDGSQKRTPAIGEFQTGSALVILTKDPIEAKVMAKLKDAHDAGALRVGGTANPFGRGSLFYDERDLSREYKTELVKDEEANRYASAYVSDTKGKLEKNGMVYSVRPSVKDPDDDIRKARFWLNYSPTRGKQIFGWFQKEQLERIASGDLSDVKD